jgi:ketosteroid isomerase-like protein
MDDIKQEILSLEEAQVDTFNRGDIDGLLTFFDPGLTGFSSTKHMRLASLNELRKTFDYYRALGQNVVYGISDPCLKLYGETAVLTFYWSVRFDDEKKRKKPVEGRGTHIYVRKDDGWKIVHEHFSRAHRTYERKR